MKLTAVVPTQLISDNDMCRNVQTRVMILFVVVVVVVVVVVANFQEANDFLLRIFVHFLADFYVTSVLAPRVTRLRGLTSI